ncbi:MAG: helix-turn-helix domain-containing protein [Micavibrio sp.]
MPVKEATRRLTQSIHHSSDCANDIKACSIRNFMTRIASKWSMLVLVTLANQPHRFLELQRAIPDVSHNMLTRTLNALKRDGLVNRRVFDTRPPNVEYSLTPLGQSLLIPLSNLVEWVDQHQICIDKVQIRYDKRRGKEKNA